MFHVIKTIKHNINPNSTIWQKTKQLNMWNIGIESIKVWEKKLNKQTCESKSETNKKQKLGFLGSGLCTQKQAWIHIIKPAYAGKIMRTWVLPGNLKNTKNKAKPQNKNPNNLTCILNIQKLKPRLEKHIKTCY